MEVLIDKWIAMQAVQRIDGVATLRDGDPVIRMSAVEHVLENLPEAEHADIIRCKDCKYRDENWRRVSVKWLPCMDALTGGNWYCGSAERGEKDG